MTTDLTSGLDTAAFSSVIKPSDDLFRFVNGPWIDTYRLPDDKARYGSFDKLAEDAESQIRDILEDEDCPAAKSQALYRSFMDTDAIEAAGATPIRPALDAIDHAADKAALTRTIGALKPIDMGPDVFDIAVFGDPKNPDTNVVHLEQSGIGLPDEAYYREDHYAPIREAYVDMVAKQLRLAGYGDEETTRAQADRFLDVETRIAANHWDNVATRDSQKTYNPTDFATLSDELAHFDIAAWADAWQGAYDATPAAKTQPVDLTAALQHTIIHEPSFLKGFDAFWNNADLDDLKLWARVHVIIGTASLLSHDYDAANFDFYGKVLSGTTQQRDRWRRGVSLVNGVCGEDVGREYVKRHFPESSKQRMGQLVDNLIDAYRVSITNSDWLGEETKAKALEKLSKFTPMIGYTERWRDYTAFDVHADAGTSGRHHAGDLRQRQKRHALEKLCDLRVRLHLLEVHVHQLRRTGHEDRQRPLFVMVGVLPVVLEQADHGHLVKQLLHVDGVLADLLADLGRCGRDTDLHRERKLRHFVGDDAGQAVILGRILVELGHAELHVHAVRDLFAQLQDQFSCHVSGSFLPLKMFCFHSLDCEYMRNLL